MAKKLRELFIMSTIAPSHRPFTFNYYDMPILSIILSFSLVFFISACVWVSVLGQRERKKEQEEGFIRFYVLSYISYCQFFSAMAHIYIKDTKFYGLRTRVYQNIAFNSSSSTSNINKKYLKHARIIIWICISCNF